MTQFEKSAALAPVTGARGARRIGRNTLMYVGVVVLIGALALIGAFGFRLESALSGQSGPPAAETVDGWMPGITAANQAAQLEAARRVQDGWSTHLLKAEPTIVDGWASRYLVDD